MERMEWEGMGDLLADPTGGWLGNCCQILCSVRSHVVLATPQIMVMPGEYFTLCAAYVESVLISGLCGETCVQLALSASDSQVAKLGEAQMFQCLLEVLYFTFNMQVKYPFGVNFMHAVNAIVFLS